MSRVRKHWGTPPAQSGVVPGIVEWEGSSYEFSVGHARMTLEQVRQFGLLLLTAVGDLDGYPERGVERLILDIEGGLVLKPDGRLPQELRLEDEDGHSYPVDPVAFIRPREGDRGETASAAAAVRAGLSRKEAGHE